MKLDNEKAAQFIFIAFQFDWLKNKHLTQRAIYIVCSQRNHVTGYDTVRQDSNL